MLLGSRFGLFGASVRRLLDGLFYLRKNNLRRLDHRLALLIQFGLRCLHHLRKGGFRGLNGLLRLLFLLHNRDGLLLLGRLGLLRFTAGNNVLLRDGMRLLQLNFVVSSLLMVQLLPGFPVLSLAVAESLGDILNHLVFRVFLMLLVNTSVQLCPFGVF